MQKLFAHLLCRICEVLLAFAALQIAQRLGSYFQS